ncbi:STM3941 family protein [Lactococcus termiticola]|uniref:Uncharacterized protein n=1 Tax=Lactococcus termiticola TaxID=2169526 RepID=A0A2R5HK27_9LACT|nr:STM3941 family protein [Lactococcus termiticola]GBG96801.1 hypothetical protein NtB2_00925 [Lactococcus termiticola]
MTEIIKIRYGLLRAFIYTVLLIIIAFNVPTIVGLILLLLAIVYFIVSLVHSRKVLLAIQPEGLVVWPDDRKSFGPIAWSDVTDIQLVKRVENPLDMKSYLCVDVKDREQYLKEESAADMLMAVNSLQAKHAMGSEQTVILLDISNASQNKKEILRLCREEWKKKQ